jgi:hypothetical protein
VLHCCITETSYSAPCWQVIHLLPTLEYIMAQLSEENVLPSFHFLTLSLVYSANTDSGNSIVVCCHDLSSDTQSATSSSLHREVVAEVYIQGTAPLLSVLQLSNFTLPMSSSLASRLTETQLQGYIYIYIYREGWRKTEKSWMRNVLCHQQVTRRTSLAVLLI